ncbi:MAG TPA: GntR family transcriptional regulator [Gemmatimonadaceae bacterium]
MSLTRHSVREQIRDALMARILDGRYAPGQRLVELQLAGEFESSQAPVREALRELEALRFVESLPHRGTRVRTVPPTEMRDAYRVRAALERAAAESAARTHGNEGAHGNDWKKLRAAVSGIEKAAAKHDVRAYVRHDERFHRALVEHAANPVLLHHWELLHVSTRALVVLRSGAIDMSRTAAEHRPILDAVEGGLVEQAGMLAFEHANQIADCLERSLGRRGAGLDD